MLLKCLKVCLYGDGIKKILSLCLPYNETAQVKLLFSKTIVLTFCFLKAYFPNLL